MPNLVKNDIKSIPARITKSLSFGSFSNLISNKYNFIELRARPNYRAERASKQNFI